MKRLDLDNKKEEIINLLLSGKPRSEVCRIVKCNYDSLKSRLDLWGYSNLKNQGGKGKNSPTRNHSSYYLKENGPTINSHKLKMKLWEDGLKEKKCEECGWSKYSIDGRLPLELDHINGNKYDNRIENLRILCPNCHSLQPTNSGCNIGKYK